MPLLNDTVQQGDTTVIEIFELHPSEIQLLKILRTSLKFGEITVKMRNGVPVRLVRVQEWHDLSTTDSS